MIIGRTRTKCVTGETADLQMVSILRPFIGITSFNFWIIAHDVLYANSQVTNPLYLINCYCLSKRTQILCYGRGPMVIYYNSPIFKALWA